MHDARRRGLSFQQLASADQQDPGNLMPLASFAGEATDCSLTARAREVASLVACGLTNREIAERLVLSARTVEGHVERARGKLGLRSRAELAAWAVRHRLVS